MIAMFKGKHEFLSNFFVGAPLTYAGRRYATSEHAFQAAKAPDPAGEEWVRSAPSPRDAKRRGRSVRMRQDWIHVREQVMKDVVRAKFRDNPSILAELLATGDEELVEGNWWGDTTWGVCRGEGQNLLGKILMEVRAEARAGALG